MLIVYRSNRAEFLAQLLAQQLRLDPPDPFTTVAVIVNTWPTSRWLTEQLAGPLGGISANLRFPFPGASLRALVERLWQEPQVAVPEPDTPNGPAADPWRAQRLVWSLLQVLPSLPAELESTDSAGTDLLQALLDPMAGAAALNLRTWQLARAIADAFDDYALYRPAMLQAWEAGRPEDGRGGQLPSGQHWQMRLYGLLRRQLPSEPFGLRVLQAVQRLEREPPAPEALVPLGGRLRLFGLSSMAPVQVRLLEALGRHLPVELFLLTPCGDLWKRCGDRRRELSDALACELPLEQDWLLQAPGLEARFGRLGSEFQQLLEGCDGVFDAPWQEQDLFLLPATAQVAAQDSPSQPVAPAGSPSATGRPVDLRKRGDGRNRPPSPSAPPARRSAAPRLLAQLQQQLADPDSWPELALDAEDQSLEFHACPGPLRQVQVLRDRLLQLLAADPGLEPRDILVMTPQVDRFAPLVAAVFSDRDATGVDLPWRLTDRTQQSDTGLTRCLLDLLHLASDRLTASGLERLLQCRALQQSFGLSSEQAAALSPSLQRAGFRWGLDADERGGQPVHSLRWAMDRLLLGLVLPERPGLAPDDTAPFSCGVPLETLGRWLQLLQRLSHWLRQLRRPARAEAWSERLGLLLRDLFADAGDAAWELPPIYAALDDWCEACAADLPALDAAVVAAVLDELLAADSGRFGHRSGALTISALEPMRAIPHRVIVLMGLEAASFPRQRQRPSFHLMDQHRRLGDPDPADQDRYALLEALLSARDHLLISWSSRDDRTGADLQPASPVRQWLQWLEGELGADVSQRLLVTHAASPLDPAEFLPGPQARPPASSDRRLLRTLQQLTEAPPPAAGGLVDQPMPEPSAPSPTAPEAAEAYEDLRLWLREPQRHWLRELGLRPSEWLQRLDDLEDLALPEYERARLLREQLRLSRSEALASPPPMSDPSFWLEQSRGQGLLPPRTAAALEARNLDQRWSSLQRSLDALGPADERLLRWQGLEAPSRWCGSHLVLVQASKVKVPDMMELWLQLLLASAAASCSAERPVDGVLIARDRNQLQPSLTLTAPDADHAVAELQRLVQLRHAWRDRCWTVPPRTGLTWVEAEAKRPGLGWERASSCWEGCSFNDGERDQAEMVICFGADRPAATLLDADFAARAEAFYRPLLEARP